MSTRNFRELLENRWSEGKFVCVGLDSEYGKFPEGVRFEDVACSIITFNKAIVEATKDHVCAYKPNIAFYEAYGAQGWMALLMTAEWIREIAPGVPVILDAKRADIGNTNNGYVRMAFDAIGADAITVHPYLGREALKPFLDQKEKGVIVLCRTSNPGAGEFQDLLVPHPKKPASFPRIPLYQYVAHQVANDWNANGNCAVVGGATYPEELARIREIVGEMPILIPGVGKQGADVEKTVKAGRTKSGSGMIVNSSSGIIFASKGADFAEAARRETEKLHDQINQYRK